MTTDEMLVLALCGVCVLSGLNVLNHWAAISLLRAHEQFEGVLKGQVEALRRRLEESECHNRWLSMALQREEE